MIGLQKKPVPEYHLCCLVGTSNAVFHPKTWRKNHNLWLHKSIWVYFHNCISCPTNIRVVLTRMLIGALLL